MKEIANCLLCDSKEIESFDTRGVDATHWRCVKCGEVLMARTMIATLPKHEDKLWLLSAYCRKRTSADLPPQMIHENNIDDFVNQMKRPSTVLEAKNRIIKYFADKSDLIGNWIDFDQYFYLDIILQQEEMQFIVKSLFEENFIEIIGVIDYSHPNLDVFDVERIRLTAEGWEAYDEIKNLNFESNQVFIAMWYSEKTKELRESLKAGVEAAGYSPIIVDETHFTGNIMDYVLSRIRESKFVIADFTVSPEEKTDLDDELSDEPESAKIKAGTRGGVYYEAGFAKGLGLEVIHTCKNENISKNRIHFDVAQENTIFWDSKDVEYVGVRSYEDREKADNIYLSEKIFDRIISIFGFGANTQ